MTAAPAPAPALPRTLALVDDDVLYGEVLGQHLSGLGIQVHRYVDGSDLLASPSAFSHTFYIIDLSLPGVDGAELIAILRRRTQAGILAVSDSVATETFGKAIDRGADVVLAKPVAFDQIAAAIRGVHRRVSAPVSQTWQLDVRASRLHAPDGAVIALSDTDLTLLQCFLDAEGRTVTRETLCQLLGHDDTPEAENLLSATVYRLRRRVERATALPLPLHTQARVGYVYKGALRQL
jgi:DNA-binding response OmpR family regulator